MSRRGQSGLLRLPMTFPMAACQARSSGAISAAISVVPRSDGKHNYRIGAQPSPNALGSSMPCRPRQHMTVRKA